MRIGVLGPFEVRTDGGTFADVSGARLRGLLVALAPEPGRVLPKVTIATPPPERPSSSHIRPE
ncbi:MAG TPA: hypothetical protein VF069_10845 [Streptosporangiaceae bacterium]